MCELIQSILSVVNLSLIFIFVCYYSRISLNLMDDIKAIITELEQEEQMASIGVELVDNEVAMIYENSNKGKVSSLCLLFQVTPIYLEDKPVYVTNIW